MEVKTFGKLEIESKGKRVYKNADESNPAVHIERDGNDVKRASELSRLRGGGDEETGGKEGSGIMAEGAGAGPSQEAQPSEETVQKQATEKSARGGKRGRKETTAATKKTTGGKRGRKKATPKETAVGEKRKREEGEAKEGENVGMKPEAVSTTEQEAGKRKTVKKVKKAKIVPEGEQAAEPAPEKEATTADVDEEHGAAAEDISETAAVEASRTETVEA